MNALQRLQAAIQGEPADRIPIFCNMLEQGADISPGLCPYVPARIFRACSKRI